MGRIRTHFIKSLTEKLAHAFPDKFSGDFDSNKKALDALKLIDEKFTRNKVAGYMVRVIKKKK